MPAITLQNLKALVSQAYKAGYDGALEMADIYVEDIISSLLTSPDQSLCKNEGWKIYRITELRMMEVGTIFEHQSRGKGWIETDGNEMYMRFHTGSISHFFEDGYPWNESMRIIGKTMKIKQKLRRQSW